MADFDEELKRQAAISSLLAQEDPGPSEDSYAASMAPAIIKPDTQADYHKLINQAFDTKTDEQVVAQPDQEQPNKKYDTVTAESVVPYGEAAREPLPVSDYAPKDTGKGVAPEDYPTIAQDQGQAESSGQQAPDALNQVERATLVKLPPQARRAELIDPDPDRNYFELNQADQPVPGFVEGSKNAIVNPATGVVKPDPTQGNLGDEELARQILAGAPSQVKPVPGFVEKSQNAIVNPAAGVVPPTPKSAYPAQIVTPEEAAGKTSVVNAPAAVAATPSPTDQAAVAVTPSPTDQAQATQPASNDEYNKLMDSFFPSAKPADSSLVPTTGEFQPDTSGSTRLNARTNNPGALGIAKWEEKYGVTSSGVTDTGHYVAQFPSKEAGAAAQFDLWRRSGQFNGQTLKGAITNWIGPGEHGEAEYISQATGIPLNQVIDEDFLKSPAGIRLMQAQAHYEGANVLTEEQWKRGQAWAYGGVAPTGETSTAAASAATKMPWDDWPKLSPAEQAAAEKEGQDFRTQQTSVLDKLNRATPNSKQFWEILQNPIEGVTDAQRQAYAENWKQKVTKDAVDFYSQKGTLLDDITKRTSLGAVVEQHIEPEEAFKKAVSDPGFEEYVRNIGRGLAGAVGQTDIGIALAGKSIDRNRVDGFMNLVHPDSTGEGRAGFVKALTDIQDTRHRHDVFNELYGALPQNTKDAIGDPASILDSIDNLADPDKQAKLNKDIAAKKAWVDQQLKGAPELRGTGADWWTTGTGENLFNTVAALVPGGVGAVVRTNTLGAQMYSSNMDRIAQEHPDWSGEKVSEEASKSAFMTLAPQEAVLAASHGLTAPLLKWAGSLAEKPIVRFGIGGGVQVGAAAVGGAAGQVGSNIAENKPLLQDVPQAAGSAIVQSLPFAVHGGLGALGHEPTPVAPEPVAPEHGRPAADYVIQHPEERTSSTVGPEQGPLLPGTFDAPIHGEMHGPAFGQLYPEPIEGDEHGPAAFARNVFTPSELRSKIEDLSQRNYSPEQLRQAIANLQPDNLRLQPEISRGLAPVREPVDLNTAIAQQRAAASLGGTPPQRQSPPPPKPAAEQFIPSSQYQEVPDWAAVPPGGEYKVNMATGKTEARWTGEVPGAEKVIDKRTGRPQSATVPPTHVSESEPFTSKIANRYTAERMASGELGAIDPSQGKSTEELIAHGLKMSPDQRERMIDNFSRGVGGDLDNQGAAIRSKEALLSQQSSEAARAAEAAPTNQQLKVQAEAALKAVTDFHNGPVKKFKRVWSDAGRGLQREIPLDYSTLNGMKEAYVKGKGNGKEASPEMEPTLKQTAARVKRSAMDEEAAINQWGEDVGKQTRGKSLPNNDSIRAKLMEIMKDLPCRN